jgi:hypothetical protein
VNRLSGQFFAKIVLPQSRRSRGSAEGRDATMVNGTVRERL